MQSTGQKQVDGFRRGPNAIAIKVVPRGFGLVRDASGKPKLDGCDVNNLPPEVYAMLTPDERAALGI